MLPEDMEWLTVAEVANHWRVSERHVRDEINRKRLRAGKHGKEWRIHRNDVASYETSVMNVRPTVKRTRPPKRRAA